MSNTLPPRRHTPGRLLRETLKLTRSAIGRARKITQRITPLYPGAYRHVEENVPPDERITPAIGTPGVRPGAYRVIVEAEIK